MQAGETGLADSVQAWHIGVPVAVDHHAATGVMRCRDDWDRLASDVDGKLQAALVDGREVRFDECFRLVTDVQIDAIDAQPLHFVIDCPGNDVARGEFCALVELRHETLAVGQLEVRAFTAQRFGDQKALGLRVIQAGRVELIELKVCHPATGAPGHRNAVAARAVRVAGVQVDLGGASRSQNGKARTISIHFAAVAIQNIGPQATLAFEPKAAFGDQINRGALLQQLDIGSLACLFEQRPENRRSCSVCSVDDSAVAMAAFSRQVKLKAAFIGLCFVAAGERYALIDQPLNRFAAVLDRKTNSVLVAQAAAGIQRVFNVGLHCICVIQHRRHSTLRPEGRTIGQISFAQNCNPQVVGEVQRQAQSGSATANYQYVVLKISTHL